LETYLHRIGRTARAGATGAAVTFIEDEDRQLLKEVVKKGKVNLKQRIVSQQVGFGVW
jgi:superfamily II DNA/RNA helicase